MTKRMSHVRRSEMPTTQEQYPLITEESPLKQVWLNGMEVLEAIASLQECLNAIPEEHRAGAWIDIDTCDYVDIRVYYMRPMTDIERGEYDEYFKRKKQRDLALLDTLKAKYGVE